MRRELSLRTPIYRAHARAGRVRPRASEEYHEHAMSHSTTQTSSPPSGVSDIPIGPQRAPRGAQRTCKTWAAEAAMRMLMNNLDPEVAEDPANLVVYGGSGKAARDWDAFRAIVATLRRLEPDETLLV